MRLQDWMSAGLLCSTQCYKIYKNNYTRILREVKLYENKCMSVSNNPKLRRQLVNEITDTY